mgnify:CR=1 FL=1
MDYKKLEEDLVYKRKNGFDVLDEEEIDRAWEFSEAYKSFIDASKTEREAVTVSIEMLKEAGFEEYKLGGEIKVGGKYYFNNRGKNLFLFTIGSESLENGIRMEMTDYKGNRIRREILLTADTLYIKDQAEGLKLRSYLHSVHETEIKSSAEIIQSAAKYAPEYGLLQAIHQITAIGNGSIELRIPLDWQREDTPRI